MNPLRQLQSLGQSIWLDDIHRGLLTGGGFRRLIEEDGISGVTSNPAILRKAILDHDDYDAAIGQLAREGSDARAAYETLVLEDLRQAADLLQPVYAASGGRDGYVSMEVSPHLAYDTEATVIAARRLWGLLDRPNVMIKVPATPEGLPAIRSLISEGINVNATLLFSLARYREVAQAFIDGLQDRQRLGKPLDGVASVASFFMSRIDVLVDKLLDSVQDEALRPRALALRGKTAIASGKIAYQDYKALFAGPDWDALAGAGARSQRLLWASTSTKNPAYSDVLYVDALIGPDTVNTVPLKTLAAYRDHGRPALRLEQDVDAARAQLQELAAVGIDLDSVTQQLLEEGIDKFIQPFDELLATLAERLA